MTLQRKSQRMPVHGVLLLDKPVGMSSTQALAKAKWLLNAQKAGHTGTLDPFATGLLPLCFGEATKFAQDLLDADKTYETVVHLGIKTSTGDTEGEVLERLPVDVTLTQIESILEKFRGPISQVPPMHSALKRDGKPLYEYARAGITLEREARSVTIHKLELLAYDVPMLRLRVACSKGTYIRVLGEDIGRALGCGGHLQSLRRISVGELIADDATTLEDFAKLSDQQRLDVLGPIDTLVSHLPELHLGEELSLRFLQGQRLNLSKEGLTGAKALQYKVYSGQRLLGLAEVSECGLLQPRTVVVS
jgi:tRNA pseudouridine55 synthase